MDSLHDILFAEINKLSDEKLTDEELQKELSRTKGICDLSDKLTNLAALQLKALEISEEYDLKQNEMPKLLA